MKFKKLKYNIICLVMVLLIVSVVMIKVYFVDEQIPDSNIDIVTPGNDPNNPDNNGGNSNNPSPEKPADDTRDKNIPSAMYPTKVLNYCLNKLASSNGYKTNIDFTTVVTAGYMGMDLKSVHTVTGTSIIAGNLMIDEMAFIPDELSAKFIEPNGLVTTYYDGKKTHIWRTPEGDFNINNARYWNVDGILNSGKERFYYNKLYPGNFNFNGKGASCKLSTQKNAKTGREEYVITVKLLDMANYPEQFLRSYKSFQWVVDMKSVEQTITFTIDKKTGWLQNYVQKDVYVGEYPGFKGVYATMVLDYSQTFTSHNQILPITHPTIPPEEPKPEG